MPKLTIIGPGRLGTALAIALQHAGHQVLGALAQSPHSESSEQFVRLTNTPVRPIHNLLSHLALIENADAVLITVPDKAVSLIAQTLGKTKTQWAGQMVLHTAGAL